MNPYGPPAKEENSKRRRLPREPLPCSTVALSFLIGGFLGGAALGTLGYVLIITAIEFMLTPPFVSPPNYGQFGFVVIGVGFYMSLFGAALGVVPYVRWIGYIPIHGLGILAILTIDQDFFSEVRWTEAPVAGMLFLFTLPPFLAILCDIWSRRLCSGFVPSHPS